LFTISFPVITGSRSSAPFPPTILISGITAGYILAYPLLSMSSRGVTIAEPDDLPILSGLLQVGGDKAGDEMNALAYGVDTTMSDLHDAAARTSTLYDLIEAVSDEAEPGEEGLIVEAVQDLMRSGKIKWVRGNRNLKQIQ
jgi:hypothetical protein